MELPEAPALICRKCEKHVLQAFELKKLCEASEKHFRKDVSSKNEYYFIHENLRELKALTKTSENAVLEKVPPVSDEVTAFLPKKSAEFVKTIEMVTRSSVVQDLPLKTRRDSLRMQKSPLPTRRSRSITSDNAPKAAQALAVSPIKVLVVLPAEVKKTASTTEEIPQIKHEEIVEDECDSQADTEVSDDNNNSRDLAFIDRLTLDQIKEMTNILAEIIMPASEQPKKKKKKKEKTRFIQRLAPNKFRIRVSKLKK